MKGKSILLFLAMLGPASPALGISRYVSTDMTCEQARNSVMREGAVILRYPSKRVEGMMLYDRYVISNEQCSPREFADRAYVPTRNEARCPVLSCKDYEPMPGLFGKPRLPF